MAINGNGVTYFDFQKRFIGIGLFSIADIRKAFPGFDFNRLNDWQDKGYIKKIVNRWYIFSEVAVNEFVLYRISNSIYKPSYISLESALAYHHLIPEGVYIQTAVSTRKTKEIDTVFGRFKFHTLKPKLFFGYSIQRYNNFPILIASPEKAIADYLYLNPQIKNKHDIVALRINPVVYKELIDVNKLTLFASEFESHTLNKKIKLLNKTVNDVVAE